MKKLIVLLLLIPSMAFGQTQILGKSVTLAWDPVTRLTNGAPIPAGSTITYKVYYGSTSGSYGSSPKLAGASTTHTLSFTTYGTKFFAVKAYLGTVSSAYSNEVSATLTTAEAPTNVRVVQ